MLITGNQLRAARALAGVEQQWVADRSGVSVNTIRNMEARGMEPITSGAVTVRKVQAAIEGAGVEFTNGGQPGVRMTRQPYTAEDLANVVARFKGNIHSLPDWPDYQILPLINGFEFWKDDERVGSLTVEQGEAIFDPPLTVPRERKDRWVTEAELRFWAQSLSYPR